MLKTELRALLDDMAQAYVAGDARACAALFCENAQLHSPFAPPAVGRAAIEALHVEWTADADNKGFAVLDCGQSGDLAWCLCRYSEGETGAAGSSLLVLERDDTGAWRIRSCCLH